MQCLRFVFPLFVAVSPLLRYSDFLGNVLHPVVPIYGLHRSDGVIPGHYDRYGDSSEAVFHAEVGNSNRES